MIRDDDASCHGDDNCCHAGGDDDYCGEDDEDDCGNHQKYVCRSRCRQKIPITYGLSCCFVNIYVIIVDFFPPTT